MGKKVRVWLTGGYADCLDCRWDADGKNAMGLASQHALKTGHTAGAAMEYAAKRKEATP